MKLTRYKREDVAVFIKDEIHLKATINLLKRMGEKVNDEFFLSENKENNRKL